MSKKSEKAAEREEAKKELLKLLKPGATVYTVLRHVSSSGMSRVIDLVIPYMRVDEYSTTADKAGKALKSGVRGYATTGARRYQSGTVIGLEGESAVVLRYPDVSGLEGGDVSYPLEDVQIYVKSKPYPAVRSIGWLAARAMDRRFVNDRHYGIQIGGCGMDMGFALVYDLGASLWPNGTKKPHSTRNGEPDTAGGYALKHTWL